MPIISFITEEKKVRSRIYVKKYAICVCDFCLIEWKAKRWNSVNKHTFCSKKCDNESRKKGNILDEKIKKTNKEKYGFESALKNDFIRDKKKENNIKKYGVANFQETLEWKEKRKKAIYEKYGDELFKTEYFKQKRKETLIEKYSVDSPIKNKDILEKRIKTNIEKYGGHPLKNKEILDKMYQTKIERYGFKSSFELEEVQKKCYLSIHGYTREEFLERIGEYIVYRAEVRRITEKQPLFLLEDYDKRGKENYHLDHIFSIAEGYKNNVSPEVIASIINLRFIKAEINRQKTDKSGITKEELLRRYNELQQKN